MVVGLEVPQILVAETLKTWFPVIFQLTVALLIFVFKIPPFDKFQLYVNPFCNIVEKGLKVFKQVLSIPTIAEGEVGILCTKTVWFKGVPIPHSLLGVMVKVCVPAVVQFIFAELLNATKEPPEDKLQV